MKLMIDMNSMVARRIPGEDFSTLVSVRNNGQHYQMDGYILADVTVGGAEHPTSIRLLHPQTTPATGHVDVTVHYDVNVPVPSFHYYGQHQRFVPTPFGDGTQGDAWPTGGWHLLQTVFAVEAFLVSDIGLRPKLRETLFAALKPVGK
jgi:hypothetical protein